MIDTSEKSTRSMMTTHSRHSVGLTYVYPVISRRAGGVSIGINLNVNNACNWRCIYCQVPDLRRGAPAPVDVSLWEKELRGFLDEVLYGSFMVDMVPEQARALKDIAFSGNGEPTATAEFAVVVDRLKQIKADYPPLKDLPVRLITNGSYLGRTSVQEALSVLKMIGGEVWFKVDAMNPAEQRRINGVVQSMDAMLKRLKAAVDHCPTWIQSCFFQFDGVSPSDEEITRYIAFCREAKVMGVRGAHLYTIARTPMQPGEHQLAPLTSSEMNAIADRLRAEGLVVTVSI